VTTAPEPAEATEIASRVLLIDDDVAICGLVSKYLQHHQHGVDVHHDGSRIDELLHNPYDVILLDLNLPGTDGLQLLDRVVKERSEIAVVMLTGHAAAETIVDCMRRGAFDYLTKPIDMQRLQIVVRNATEHTRLRLESDGLRASLIRGDGGPDLICASQAMTEVISLVERVASSNVPVLLHGESGAGKNVVAHRIHARSRYKDGPFVHINCNALPADTMDSELFGDDEGGKLLQATDGTLFLDEVGELDPELQTKLLRVLTQTKPEARIIAATSRHLPSEVSRGKFRADLFYRLNVFSITVPPLRDHRDDIPALARYAAARFAARENRPPPRIEDEALDLLKAYNWPGNVRELNNVVERAALLSPSGSVRASDLPDDIHTAAKAQEEERKRQEGLGLADPDGGSNVRPLKDLEREMMVAALKETRGNVSEAARRLGIGRATFYRRAQRHGLTREDGFPG
jgi:DNA-binding NtrC family response regulator